MWNKVDLKSDQPCELSYQFIKKITNDYDQERIIGSGTFGIVYKGICENGEKVAVKVPRNITGIDNKDFQKEFENLWRLEHQNVVQLLGFCNEKEKVLAEHNGNQVVADKMHTALIFEYVCNGSLDNHISADGCSGLNWHTQYKIIKGICQGLEYLQHGFELSVWHLDLKPGNILLDNNMIPKIADFGLSRLLGDENTRKTINNVGTCGYMPPEYIDQGLISKKFDIFSLGVIIAKLMAGREGYFKIDDMGEEGFVKHVYDNWRKRLSATLAARPLVVYCKQVRMCIQIAVKCMNHERQARPTIQSIVSDLIKTEIMIGNVGLETEQSRQKGERYRQSEAVGACTESLGSESGFVGEEHGAKDRAAQRGWVRRGERQRGERCLPPAMSSRPAEAFMRAERRGGRLILTQVVRPVERPREVFRASRAGGRRLLEVRRNGRHDGEI